MLRHKLVYYQYSKDMASEMSQIYMLRYNICFMGWLHLWRARVLVCIQC